MEELTIKIDAFEGPLDLLLYLIKQLEIDIYDIPIAEITDQYISYLKSMEELELDIAGDFLIMAATLMSIKSAMLLPRVEVDDVEDPDIAENHEEGEDPRQHLMQMLIEYQYVKEASQEFKKREAERSQHYQREPADLSPYLDYIPLDDGQHELAELGRAMQMVIAKHQLMNPNPAFIEKDEVSIDEKMDEIESVFQKSPNRSISFSKLIQSESRSGIIATFLAILELVKRQEITAQQEKNYEDIILNLEDHE